MKVTRPFFDSRSHGVHGIVVITKLYFAISRETIFHNTSTLQTQRTCRSNTVLCAVRILNTWPNRLVIWLLGYTSNPTIVFSDMHFIENIPALRHNAQIVQISRLEN